MSQTETLHQEAERIAYKTDLDNHESAVVAAEREGIDQEILLDELAMTNFGLDEMKSELRQRRLEIEDEIERLKKTRDALEEL